MEPNYSDSDDSRGAEAVAEAAERLNEALRAAHNDGLEVAIWLESSLYSWRRRTTDPPQVRVHVARPRSSSPRR